MTRLSKAPLVYTLCQVRFSAVLNMSDYIPKIQEALRREFPIYQELTIQGIKISGKGQIETSAQTQWSFADKTNTRGYLVMPESIAFHTTRYPTFEEFAAPLRSGLEILHAHAAPALTQRIGLRYIDQIVPSDGENLSSLLRESLTGFPAEELESALVQHRQETICDTPSGRMIIKLVVGRHSSIVPPDLQSVTLESGAQIHSDKITALLDNDHYVERNTDFKVDEIMSVVDGLHDYTGRAFRLCVSKTALKKWE
jgi:uncharacterized protein (TIGR04255 family)